MTPVLGWLFVGGVLLVVSVWRLFGEGEEGLPIKVREFKQWGDTLGGGR
jgi:hypothetical protein